jgi:hypothetical protein
MEGFLPVLIFAAVLAAVMAFFTWLAVLARRRGVAGGAIRGVLASYDLAFHGTAHESHHELRAQAQRNLPITSPDDPWRPATHQNPRRARGDVWQTRSHDAPG